MSKKKYRHEKEVSKLRRENEALRAQLKAKRGKEVTRMSAVEDISSPISKVDQKGEEYLNPEHLKEDLTKTLLITSFSILILSLLFYTQPWWPKF